MFTGKANEMMKLQGTTWGSSVLEMLAGPSEDATLLHWCSEPGPWARAFRSATSHSLMDQEKPLWEGLGRVLALSSSAHSQACSDMLQWPGTPNWKKIKALLSPSVHRREALPLSGTPFSSLISLVIFWVECTTENGGWQ